MQQIKRQIQLGNVELARLNSDNQPVPIQYSDLQSTQKTRNNNAKIVAKLKELSVEEKQEWVSLKRLRANQLCRGKKWEEAMEVYLEAMLGIDISEKNEQKLKQINFDQKYPILLNIVTCNYMLKNYQVALQLCDRVLAEKHGENNLKALYKKANCLVALGDLNGAYQLAQRLSRLKKEEGQEQGGRGSISRQDIAKLVQQINAKNRNQKVVYQKMFSPKDEEEESLLPSSSQEKQQIIDYQYGIKEQCVDWCKQTWQNVWSCLSRKRAMQKIE